MIAFTISRREERADRRWAPRGVSPMPPALASTPRVPQHPLIALLASTNLANAII